MRITKKQDRMPGIILTILLFVAEIAFTVLLLYTNLLSAKYIGIVFAVLLVLLLIDHLLIRKFRKQIRFWIGIILMVIILAVLGIASFYIYKTIKELLNEIDSKNIVQINRKNCVNINHIISENKTTIKLDNGLILKVGKMYKKNLKQF